MKKPDRMSGFFNLELTPRLMSYLPQKDWTLGCIAVRNVDIDKIWQLVDNHIVIDIYP